MAVECRVTLDVLIIFKLIFLMSLTDFLFDSARVLAKSDDRLLESIRRKDCIWPG